MHPYRTAEDFKSDSLAVIYVEGASSLHSIIAKNGRTQYGRETVSEVRSRYAGKRVSVMPISEAMKRVEADLKGKYCHPISEITEEQFFDALNCLPTENWRRGDGWEAFRLSEYACWGITTHFLRVGERYFSKCVEISSTVYDQMRNEAASIRAVTN